MDLIAHITLAILSLAGALWTLFSPSRIKLQISRIFVVSTFVSGFILLFTRSANLSGICVSGLVYLIVISIPLSLAQKKLKPSSPLFIKERG